MHNPLSARPDRIDAPLYVITAIANPLRFRSRWSRYHDFVRHMRAVGARLHTVEVAHGERAFAVTGRERLQIEQDDQRGPVRRSNRNFARAPSCGTRKTR